VSDDLGTSLLQSVIALHEQIRQAVEQRSNGTYHVTRIEATTESEYMHPMHALGEHPDFILTSAFAMFTVEAQDAVGLTLVRCKVDVMSDGRLRIGEFLARRTAL